MDPAAGMPPLQVTLDDLRQLFMEVASEVQMQGEGGGNGAPGESDTKPKGSSQNERMDSIEQSLAMIMQQMGIAPPGGGEAGAAGAVPPGLMEQMGSGMPPEQAGGPPMIDMAGGGGMPPGMDPAAMGGGGMPPGMPPGMTVQASHDVGHNRLGPLLARLRSGNTQG
jgi:hypothetical protein